MSVNAANANPASSCTVASPQTYQCYTTTGGSFFQFEYSDTLSAITSAGTLTITDCTFQHFFYDFTSLIGLMEGHGNVVITGSTFTKFSNCGSIIRDTREYPNLNYNDNTKDAWKRIMYRDTMLTSQILQEKLYVKPAAKCILATCASISIKTSTFDNFNYLKAAMTALTGVSATSKMKYQGVILNLADFYGRVVLQGNTFTGIKFGYQRCELYNLVSATKTNTLWEDSSSEYHHVHSLIYINVKSSEIEIYENTFTSCNSYSGLIYIYRLSSQNGPVLIHKNTFTKNSAISESNAVRVVLFSDVRFNTAFSKLEMV